MFRLTRAARVALALLALCVVSCAGLSGPVRVEAHLPSIVPRDVPPDRPRLGVGRFVDARPRSDRIERRPGRQIRWYGIERRGEYQTGDTSFLGSVAEGIREDAVATLARSGAFSEVRALDVGETEASAVAAAGTVDFVLTATVEEFAGIQRHDSLISFFLLGGVWSRTDDPVGLARIHYKVYGSAGAVLEERIDTVQRGSAPDPARAALDAAARANERVAERLFRSLVPEAVRVRRELPLEVVDGCGLARPRVLHLVEEASEVLERAAGVRLRPRFRRRPGATPARLADALAAARRESPPPGGALVWLGPSGGAAGADPYGLSVPLGEHAVVACSEAGDVPVVTLAHEIAHLFGAVHVDARSSVMNRVAEFDGRFFDPLNRRILRATSERPFGESLPEGTRARLHALYRAALSLSSGVDEREVRALLASVGAAGAP
jgi:hypothetical protein